MRRKILETIKRDWAIYFGYAMTVTGLVIYACEKNLTGVLLSLAILAMWVSLHFMTNLTRSKDALLKEVFDGWRETQDNLLKTATEYSKLSVKYFRMKKEQLIPQEEIKYRPKNTYRKRNESWQKKDIQTSRSEKK